MPAFSAILPGSLDWRDMAQPMGPGWLAILDVYPGRLQCAAGVGGIRFARIISSNGAPTHFIKIVPETHWPKAQCVSVLANKLAARGCDVVRGGGTAWVLSQHQIALIYDWCSGRHVDAATVDFVALGTAIARLHNAASDFGKRYEVTIRTDARLSYYQDVVDGANFNHVWAKHSHESFVLARRDDFIIHQPMMRADSTPIHADLNPGNILIDLSNKIVFLDLEDMAHSDLWPGLDLAKIWERLILPHGVKRGPFWTEEALSALLRGYRSITPSRIFTKERLAQSLLWQMGLAVAIITDDWVVDSDVALQELEKFKELHRLIALH